MTGLVAQISFSSQDIGYFTDLAHDDGVDRRMVRIAGAMSGDQGKAPVEVTIQAGGQGAGPRVGVLAPHGRGWQAEMAVPPALFAQLEKAFFSPASFRFLLTLSLGHAGDAVRPSVIADASLMITRVAA